ncbi:hypothetical protein [Desulfomonile tiedjei]|uniref:Uncharacterized protein n=1 Tax=Desulfomonile tiedjei (strain ATCC 49306 / DSM 6799 / DCB-1) TaxID=706587 RepID=I4C303_DESTA|nr:hypothetical protein [Desulfomonile tiedjei]AFM23944.1 hypothetical protein Desti_1231 [Desulfomonile tiedjei DSM 6799]
MVHHKHDCNYPLIRVLPRSVHTMALVVWYDGDPESSTYKQPLDRCPSCGQDLRADSPELSGPLK